MSGLPWVALQKDDTIEAFCSVCHHCEFLIYDWRDTLWAEGLMMPVRIEEFLRPESTALDEQLRELLEDFGANTTPVEIRNRLKKAAHPADVIDSIIRPAQTIPRPEAIQPLASLLLKVWLDLGRPPPLSRANAPSSRTSRAGDPGEGPAAIPLNEALSPAELLRLRTFLACQVNGMPLEQVHGFITAILSGPTMRMPSTWQRIIFGGAPTFHSAEEASEIIGLVMRLYNQIGQELERTRFVPLGAPNRTALTRWISGYIVAADGDPQWRAHEQAQSDLEPLLLVLDELEPVDAAALDPRTTAALKEETFVRLGSIVLGIHESWRKARSEMHRGSPPPQKVGRNAPCPCGSGKKFKRCCRERKMLH